MKKIIFVLSFLAVFSLPSCNKSEDVENLQTKENQLSNRPRRSLPNANYYSFLGFGVKDVREDILTSKIFTNDFEINPVDCTEPSDWSITVTTNSSELREKVMTAISVEASGAYCGLSMSGSYKQILSDENTSKRNSIYGVAIMKMVKGEIVMNMNSYKSSILESTYKSMDPADFRNSYGDKFISGAVLGGMVLVKFEFTDVENTSNSSSTITAKAKAAMGSMVSGSMSFEQVKTCYSEFKNSSLIIRCTSGGPIVDLTNSINEIPNVVNKAKEQVDNNQNLTRIINRYTYYSDIISGYSFIPTKKYADLKRQWVSYRSRLVGVEPCLSPTSSQHTEVAKRIDLSNLNIAKLDQLQEVGCPANDVARICLVDCSRYYEMCGNVLNFVFKPCTGNEDLRMQGFTRHIYVYPHPDIFPGKLIPLYERRYEPKIAKNKLWFISYSTSFSEGASSRVSIVGYIFRSFEKGTVPVMLKNVNQFPLSVPPSFPSYADESITIAGFTTTNVSTLGFVVEDPNLIAD